MGNRDSTSAIQQTKPGVLVRSAPFRQEGVVRLGHKGVFGERYGLHLVVILHSQNFTWSACILVCTFFIMHHSHLFLPAELTCVEPYILLGN